MKTDSQMPDSADTVSSVNTSAGETPSSSQHAVDGSQYHSVIEEQIYAEQSPTAEEQKPWRIFHPDAGKRAETPADVAAMSVGPQ